MSEKMQILNMVEEGKITAAEGIKLLEALENTANETSDLAVSNLKAKWLRVKVFDPKNTTKVNIKLPISLITIGVKLASKFSPELREAGINEENLEEIFATIKSGATGKIMDIDSDDGTKVEIVVD